MQLKKHATQIKLCKEACAAYKLLLIVVTILKLTNDKRRLAPEPANLSTKRKNSKSSYCFAFNFYIKKIYKNLLDIVVQLGMCLSLFFVFLHLCHTNGIYWPQTRVPLSEDWVHMSQTEAYSYYTAQEVCGLVYPYPEARNCKNVPGNLFSCNVFHHLHDNNYQCTDIGALTYRHKSTSPWPKSAHLVDLIALMRERKSNTLIIAGDSVSKQFYDDAICSATRAGMKLSSQRAFVLDKSTRTVTHVAFAGSDGSVKFSVPFFQIYFVLTGHTHEDDVYTYRKWVDTPSVLGVPVMIANTGIHFKINEQGGHFQRHMDLYIQW